MNIGFDAKRAYHNSTGLGHYSRTLISSLADYFPGHHYYLFNPRKAKAFDFPLKENIHEILPNGFINKLFSSAWRSSWVRKDLKKSRINIYHGLSHEIPLGIQSTGIKSVVTIHDLIHEQHPEQYNAIDVKIYKKKFRNACRYSNKIIAISEETRKHIINYYKVPEGKITVCYQSCNPVFEQEVSEEQKEHVRKKYGLPSQFFLSVGSIIERKNLLNICKAISILQPEFNIPLIVIGDGGEYKKQVKDYIQQNKLGHLVYFLSESPSAKSEGLLQSSKDFPAIYQSAIAMIYPSFFEGFGIPVLEALWSRLPVITSNVSSLPEAGGDAAYYVDPAKADEIADAMMKVYTDQPLTQSMKQKGWNHAQKFTREKTASKVMDVYKSL